jgi:hypothetical protein
MCGAVAEPRRPIAAVGWLCQTVASLKTVPADKEPAEQADHPLMSQVDQFISEFAVILGTGLQYGSLYYVISSTIKITL